MSISKQLPNELRGGESGATLITVTIFMVALFGFAALSLDVGNVMREQRKAHAAADAGSLAASDLLTNSPQNAGSITSLARDIALANGLTDAEIAAGAHSNCAVLLPGQIQVGRWNQTTKCFSANASPYNAVRVPARRNVLLNFGRVVGISEMNPYIDSIAALTGVGRTNTNTIPFAITVTELAGKTFNDTLTMNQAGDPGTGSGKWGKINLPGICGVNNSGYQNPGEWRGDMNTSGYTGTVSVGCVNVITGDAQIRQAWQQIPLGSVVTVPIVDQFYNSGNSTTANIVGFVVAEVIASGGSGSNWSADLKFLSIFNGSGGGGTCDPPCIQTRALVE